MEISDEQPNRYMKYDKTHLDGKLNKLYLHAEILKIPYSEV